jgi:hypothetical protein
MHFSVAAMGRLATTDGNTGRILSFARHFSTTGVSLFEVALFPVQAFNDCELSGFFITRRVSA